jgi:hypothetical protein
MTAKSSKRVVIINNIKSDKIEQAIFILRGSNLCKPDKGIIKEAQNIIDDYVKKIGGGACYIPPSKDFTSRPEKKKNKRAGMAILIFSAVLLCLVFLVRSLSN